MPKKAKLPTKKYSAIDEDKQSNIVSEPLAVLSSSYSLGKIIILAESTQKPESHMSPFEKMNIVRQGISKKDLEQLKKKVGVDYEMLAKALNVTRATLINKKGNEKFNTVISEKIVSIADLYSYGFEIFGDEDHFRQWMNKPNKAIGGQGPYDIIDNQYGREEIKNLIGRIAYGVYS